MITIKSEHEIELMRKAGEILARVHLEIADAIRPGITVIPFDALSNNLPKLMDPRDMGTM